MLMCNCHRAAFRAARSAASQAKRRFRSERDSGVIPCAIRAALRAAISCCRRSCSALRAAFASRLRRSISRCWRRFSSRAFSSRRCWAWACWRCWDASRRCCPAAEHGPPGPRAYRWRSSANPPELAFVPIRPRPDRGPLGVVGPARSRRARRPQRRHEPPDKPGSDLPLNTWLFASPGAPR